MKKLMLLLKSLIYQGNWNYENMQGSGFKFLLQRLKKYNYLEIDDKDIINQDEYFNTHPFFITFILGIWSKEYKKENGRPDYFKKTYASAFAALGDSFIWHSLRPFCFIISAIICIYNPYLGFLFYLIFFNLFHFFFLYVGYDVGYELNREVINWFNRIKFNKWSSYFDIFSSFLLGLFLSKLIKSVSYLDIKFYAIATLFLFVGFIIGKTIDILHGLIVCVGIIALIAYLTGV